ncbi:hypothetical protein [Streptomyces somaliensis]|uniref:hypothetical protein n=1 Tax=Streptomyces somaliensis TaxID=78355 RepID=UPI00029A5E71|nr:hypothetical protein [Streptomyces somaliensis]
MADERYEWLDHEAAERLLRGEPVDADDDYTQWRIKRLSDALAEARDATAPLAGVSPDLPGEEAALAAFRAARTARAARSRPAAGPDAAHLRKGPALRPPGRSRARGWTRPARWGLAASVAGLAVGGVAVAAGTGVLPVFGPHEAPPPAVSAPAPGEPEATKGPAVGPRGSAGPGRSTGSGAPRPTPPVPSPGAGGAATAGDDGPGGGAPTASTRPGDRDRTEKVPDGTWSTRIAQDCRDFRDGRIEASRRQQLELAAKATGGVRQFCEQVLSGGRQSGAPTLDTGAVGGLPDLGTDTGGADGGGADGGGDADGPDAGTVREGDRDAGGGERSTGNTGRKPPGKGGGKAP